MHIRRLAALTVLGACLVAGLLPTAVLAGGPTSGHVAGTVRDLLTGEPIADVDVTAFDSAEVNRGTDVTDAEGEFLILNLPADNYTLDFFRVGYVIREIDHLVSGGDIDVVEVDMVPGEGTTNASSIDILTGKLLGGRVASLRTDNNKFMTVASRAQNDKQRVRWVATFENIPRTLQAMHLTYKGSNSASCLQRLEVFDWDTTTWDEIDERSVGTTEKLISVDLAGGAPGYVEGEERLGRVKLRFTCVRGTSFQAKSDLLQLYYKAGAES